MWRIDTLLTFTVRGQSDHFFSLDLSDKSRDFDCASVILCSSYATLCRHDFCDPWPGTATKFLNIHKLIGDVLTETKDSMAEQGIV